MKTKIDIISGFLGAGKTTLIRKLVSEKLNQERVVIIENEFGETGIDGSLMKNSNIEVKEINAGCICCSMSGEFIDGILEVLQKYKPERIMIEPTGVGKLNDVLKACENRRVREQIAVNMVLCVVDITKFRLYLNNFGEFFENQIKYAKTILLSRTANTETAKVEHVVNEIRKINDRANIVTTDWRQLDSEQLLQLAEAGEEYTLEQQLRKKIVISMPGKSKCSCGGHGHSAEEAFEAWEIETPKKYSREQLQGILEVLKQWDQFGMVLRSKGILESTEGGWLHYDFVPGEAEIRSCNADYSGRICVIGSKLDREALEELFNI